MRKIIYYGLISLALLLGCNADENEYAELLVGKWLFTEMNGQAIMTDDASYIDYRANGVQVFANGYQLDENNKTWVESDKYNYKIIDHIITVEGADANGKQNYIEIEILSINDKPPTQKTKKYLIDNVDYIETDSYTYKRVSNDLSAQFAGVWYGHCTTPGTSDIGYHYWEYFSDWSYNYYYQNDQGKWIKKSDNEGRYFLYGNLFVSNYSNDIVTGGKGKTFECWNFTIEGNTMTWSAIRNNNAAESYQMTKVDNPPSIN